MLVEIYQKRSNWIYLTLTGENGVFKEKYETGPDIFRNICVSKMPHYVADDLALNVGFTDDRIHDPELTGRKSVRKALVSTMLELALGEYALTESCRETLAKLFGSEHWSSETEYLARNSISDSQCYERQV